MSQAIMNLVGRPLTGQQLSEVKNPRIEVALHVALKLIQTFTFFGVCIVAPALYFFTTTSSLGFVTLAAKSGWNAIPVGLVLGPLMSKVRLSNQTDEQVVERCHRLRKNGVQLGIDRGCLAGALTGAMLGVPFGVFKFGLLVGLLVGATIADPVIKECLKSADADAVLVHCGVGGIPYWKNQSNDFRMDSQMKLKSVPTLMRWGKPQRLEESQCADKSLVEMMFSDE
ncbi:hypothetical protein CAPTEDRAFT_228764 [Capitella teleta]|uniref:Thioredoxin domain-containing protein n=1 Tax=Capitella teleta TaxID=283909 RepID=R7TPI7_CAPTE|nr:hypothetical protein CAPTEDRAFT_228764 [Capitella teleta]|eukprot:ELT93421.1 hypothetical protein CAPTEDRAFT_228764 [Capitella teleta]